MPFIARPIEIRHVRQKNCLAWQKHAYVRTRSFVGKIPDVPAAERGDRAYDYEENDPFHGRQTVAAGVSPAKSKLSYPMPLPLRKLDLCPRMKLPMYGFKPLLIDMGVNLRCRNICVAEHFLDDAQVGAIAQQMRRKTMPEKMGINVLPQPGVPRTFFHDLPDARRC